MSTAWSPPLLVPGSDTAIMLRNLWERDTVQTATTRRANREPDMLATVIAHLNYRLGCAVFIDAATDAYSAAALRLSHSDLVRGNGRSAASVMTETRTTWPVLPVPDRLMFDHRPCASFANVNRPGFALPWSRRRVLVFVGHKGFWVASQTRRTDEQHRDVPLDVRLAGEMITGRDRGESTGKAAS